VNIAERESSIELWHKRLGHMSEKGLHSLAHKDFLPKLKGMTLKLCVDCLAGKQHRIAFHTSTVPYRAKNILDLVHTNVCFMAENSLSGALYFVTFIDDHSRKVFACLEEQNFRYLMLSKSFMPKLKGKLAGS
jgi:hypothetical protein